jgi:hypothetical protein
MGLHEEGSVGSFPDFSMDKHESVSMLVGSTAYEELH